MPTDINLSLAPINSKNIRRKWHIENSKHKHGDKNFDAYRRNDACCGTTGWPKK